MSDRRIEAEWQESYDNGVWTGVPDPEAHERLKAFLAPYEGRFDTILEVAEDHIYKQIWQDLGPEIGVAEFSPEEQAQLTAVLPEETTLEEFVWRDIVGGSELLLVSTLMRAAKEEKSRRISLTGQEWGRITFERRGINPDGEVGEEWLEKVCGETDPDHQKKILGYCALKMIESGAFNEPQELAFRGEVAALYTPR